MKQRNKASAFFPAKELPEMLKQNEDWIMERILNYAKLQGYAAYTSTLKEPWRLSVSGLSASITEALQFYGTAPEIGPEDNFREDPVALFGIFEAQRHRERGISLDMFLGLFKYYRHSFMDLIRYLDFEQETERECRLFLDRIFDRIEIGICLDWAGGQEDDAIRSLQTHNRLMTNEKNRYLTIFESLPNPVLIINPDHTLENMNLAAADLFTDHQVPGAQYYCISRDRQLRAADGYDRENDPAACRPCPAGLEITRLMPWLKEEFTRFNRESLASTDFEKTILHRGKHSIFRVKLAKSLDISGKFEGTIIILEDITSLKKALEEVKTLKGFIPICMHCKNIRDDQGFWQKVESYVTRNSEAVFSHSICPVCARKHYPEFDVG
jgi:PAS domain-containing protein